MIGARGKLDAVVTARAGRLFRCTAMRTWKRGSPRYAFMLAGLRFRFWIMAWKSGWLRYPRVYGCRNRNQTRF